MPYNIYQNDELIAERIEEKEYTVEGLTPNTEYSFSVSEVFGEEESERSEPVVVMTKYSDVESVTVSPKNNNLEVGATRNLSATVDPDTANQEVSWLSDDENVASVSNGTVTAIAPGMATITAMAGDVYDTATVNVTQPVEGVTISPTSATLEVDGTQQLTSTVDPENASDKSVSYASNNTDVATVNDDGLVTAIAEGEATITVTTTSGNHADTSVITVNAPDPVEPEDPEEQSDGIEPESVEITPAENNLSETNVIRQLNATVFPEEADQTVTWSTEDESIARVEEGGLLRSLGVGETTITATAVNGIEGTATVSVAGEG